MTVLAVASNPTSGTAHHSSDSLDISVSTELTTNIMTSTVTMMRTSVPPPLLEKPSRGISSGTSTTEVTLATEVTEEATQLMSSESETEDDDEDEHCASEATASPVVVETAPSLCEAKETPRPRRRSSIKPYKSSDIPIVNKSWKTLPKLNMERLQTTETVSSEHDEAEDLQLKRPKHVVFDHIAIRNYSQTLGDNPSVSYGPPIQLDWEFEEMEDILVDDYEHSRAPRRTLRQLMLNYYARTNILTYCCGASEQDVEKATKQANKTKCQRSLTNALKPLYLVESATESLGRKVKRRFGRKR